MPKPGSELAILFIRQFELHKNKEMVSLRAHEFTLLRKLIPISPEYVVKNKQGEITLFMFKRQTVLKALKNTYEFVTVKEAEKQVQEVFREETQCP